jgi:hypothetical protein
MTAVWNKISELAGTITDAFSLNSTFATSHNVHGYSWTNEIFSSDLYRRAHVEIVDFRETHKIYILHATVFPHYNDPSPIWGFDAVCGPNKITGAFHDFSCGGDSDHAMMRWFRDQVADYRWRKPRTLPPWAQAIFSPSMIAAGNVTEGEELDALCDLAIKSLQHYLLNVGKPQEPLSDFHMAQDRYCRYQKQNPHVINSMIAMGVPESVMKQFVDDVLFPESR